MCLIRAEANGTFKSFWEIPTYEFAITMWLHQSGDFDLNKIEVLGI